MIKVPLETIRGDTPAWLITPTRDGGTVPNLDRAYITFTARLDPDDANPPLIQHDSASQFISVNGGAGTFFVSLASDDTLQLSPDVKTVLFYDIRVVEEDGTTSSVIGTLTVFPNVTH